MRRHCMVVTAAILMLPAIAVAQSAPKKGNRLQQLAGKLADTAATSAAAMVTDSLLGTRAGATVVSALGGGAAAAPAAIPTCAAGQVLYAVSPGTAGASPASPPPSPGSMLVGAAKKRLLKKKGADSAAATPAPAAGPRYACGTAEQATASMQGGQAAQAAQAQQQPGAASAAGGVGAVLAASPTGMLVSGAVAMAPAAGKAAKALGSRFGLMASLETMIRDLARGMLRLKGIKFVEGSDAIYPGFEGEIAMLAEALQTVEGQFVLNVPAEGDGKSEPDTAIARRRILKIWTHMQVGGIPATRLIALGVFPSEYDAKRKPPKKGGARVEILRMPAAETKP